MGRRKRARSSGGGDGWLVTFSDLMTLLLTFFVLLLSMSSMDSVTLTRISAFSEQLTDSEPEAAGQLQQRVQEILEIIKDPESILEKQDRLKDLLFPHDILPLEMLVDIKDNTQILQHPEGVVIVLNDGLLFLPLSATLEQGAKKLLDSLSPVILAVNSDVNISGHTDSLQSTAMSNYELSMLRSLAVLDYFLLSRIPPDRFSISSYGPDKPIKPNSTESGRRQNRRVEILLKTTKWIGRYL